MSSKTKKLGTLADIYQAQKLDGAITQIRLDRIQPSQEQPRQNRTTNVDDLAISLKNDGLLSPIVVKKEGDYYRIIAGERRYHAACKLGWERVECRIISREEQDYWRIAIIENLQRENLSAGEEAVALLRLKKQDNLNDAQLAKSVGKSRNYITEILGIAQLPEEVLENCQAHGIKQRNMLIQVVQSYRKGHLEAFLDSYRKGEIRTISKARQFNKKKDQNRVEKKQQKVYSTNSDKIKRKTYPKSDFTLSIKGKAVIINCPQTKIAQDLSEQIQLHFF